MSKNKKGYDPEKLLRGMAGFINYGLNNNLPPQQILGNLAHDIAGYLKDSKQDWFCPRTSNYEKYIIK